MITNSELQQRAGLSLAAGALGRVVKNGRGGAEPLLQAISISSKPCAVLLNDSVNRAWVSVPRLPEQLLSSGGDGYAIVDVIGVTVSSRGLTSSSGAPIFLSALSIEVNTWTDEEEEEIPMVSMDGEEEPPMLEAPRTPSTAASNSAAAAAAADITNPKLQSTLAPVKVNSTLSVADISAMLRPEQRTLFRGLRFLTIDTVDTGSSGWWTVVRLVRVIPKQRAGPTNFIVADATGAMSIATWSEYVGDESVGVSVGDVFAMLGNGKVGVDKFVQGVKLQMIVSLQHTNEAKRVHQENTLTVVKIDEKAHPKVATLVAPPAEQSVVADVVEPPSTTRQFRPSEAEEFCHSAGQRYVEFDLVDAWLVDAPAAIKTGTSNSRRTITLADHPGQTNGLLRFTVWGESVAESSLNIIAKEPLSSLLHPSIPITVSGMLCNFTKDNPSYRIGPGRQCAFRLRDADAPMSTGTQLLRDSVHNLVSLSRTDDLAESERFSLLCFVPAITDARPMPGPKQFVKNTLNLFDKTGTYTMTVFPTTGVVSHIQQLPGCKVTRPALNTLPDSIDPEIAERALSQMATDPTNPDSNIYECAPDETPLVLFSDLRMFISAPSGGRDVGRRYISSDAQTKIVVVPRDRDDPDVRDMVAWYKDHHPRFQAKLQPWVSKDLANYKPGTPALASYLPSPVGSAMSRSSAAPRRTGLMEDMDSRYSSDAHQEEAAAVDAKAVEQVRQRMKKRSYFADDEDD